MDILYIYAKQLNELNETLLNLQRIVDIAADPQDVECFLQALEQIKATVEALPLAR